MRHYISDTHSDADGNCNSYRHCNTYADIHSNQFHCKSPLNWFNVYFDSQDGWISCPFIIPCGRKISASSITAASPTS